MRSTPLEPKGIRSQCRNYYAIGASYANTANILQMVGNQTCKQNEIYSSWIPKSSCYSDTSNPDLLQLKLESCNINYELK